MSGRARRLVDLIGYCGASYRSLDYWVRQGYIGCREPAPGSGYQRTLTDQEYEVAARLCELVEAGLRVDVAAQVARAMVATGSKVVVLSDYVRVEHAPADEPTPVPAALGWPA